MLPVHPHPAAPEPRLLARALAASSSSSSSSSSSQKGGDKRMPAEVFEQYDEDGDGVLSKEEFGKAKSKFRSHEN